MVLKIPRVKERWHLNMISVTLTSLSYVPECTHACVRVHVEARGQPRVPFLRGCPPCLFEARSFTGLELDKQARLAGL